MYKLYLVNLLENLYILSHFGIFSGAIGSIGKIQEIMYRDRNDNSKPSIFLSKMFKIMIIFGLISVLFCVFYPGEELLKIIFGIK